MKRLSSIIRVTSVLVLAGFLLTGCLKDKCSHSYSIYLPVYKTTEQVRANVKSNAPKAIVNPGKFFIKGNYIFLNDVDKGIHIIDNSIPSAPRNVAFIDIPGNMDVAVKGNMLYADLYADLVALDITNPMQVVVKKFIDGAFPERRYAYGFVPDTQNIIVDWVKKDTTVVNDCSANMVSYGCPNCLIMDMSSTSYSSLAAPTASPFGMGGSTARFAIVNERLYTVSNSDLNVYSISTPENPAFSSQLPMQWSIETIYPLKDKLFLGSQSGMFIYDITDADHPSKIGQFSHATACDPVIADNNNAFVTLRSGVRCSNASNQLDVLDISTIEGPVLLKTYPMTNPSGLSKDGSTLFICDGKDGLKVYDATNVTDLKLNAHFEGFEPNDVIAYNKLAIVVSNDGLREYDYSNTNDIKLLSKITLSK